jgi:hypothetical protein
LRRQAKGRWHAAQVFVGKSALRLVFITASDHPAPKHTTRRNRLAGKASSTLAGSRT